MSAGVVAAHYVQSVAATGYVAGIIARNPVVYYRLGEASGTVMTDASGHGNHGTYLSSPTLGATGLLPGDTDTAAGFYLSSSGEASAAAQTNGAFTFECITRFTDSVTTTVLASCQQAASIGNSRWSIAGSGATRSLRFAIYSGGSTFSVTGSTSIAINTTHQVAMTWDGTTVRGFLDGVQIATNTPGVTPNAANRPVRIGSAYNTATTGANPWRGIVDEASYCDYAVTSSEIAASFARSGL